MYYGDVKAGEDERKGRSWWGRVNEKALLRRLELNCKGSDEEEYLKWEEICKKSIVFIKQKESSL